MRCSGKNDVFISLHITTSQRFPFLYLNFFIHPTGEIIVFPQYLNTFPETLAQFFKSLIYFVETAQISCRMKRSAQNSTLKPFSDSFIKTIRTDIVSKCCTEHQISLMWEICEFSCSNMPVNHLSWSLRFDKSLRRVSIKRKLFWAYNEVSGRIVWFLSVVLICMYELSNDSSIVWKYCKIHYYRHLYNILLIVQKCPDWN